MAAPSPVLIVSSSPESIRPASTTPQCHERSHFAVDLPPSSPYLPSPSAFVKSVLSESQFGTQARANEVEAGFTMAGGLSKTYSTQPSSRSMGEEDRRNGATSRNTGTIERIITPEERGTRKRPGHKSVKTSAHANPGRTIQPSPSDGTTGRDANVNASAFSREQPMHSRHFPDAAVVWVNSDGPLHRTEYSPATISESVPDVAKPVAPLTHEESTKKPRKRAARATGGLGKTPSKRPRKRQFKSASIILNSDEPVVAEEHRSSALWDHGSVCQHNPAGMVLPSLDRWAKTALGPELEPNAAHGRSIYFPQPTSPSACESLIVPASASHAANVGPSADSPNKEIDEETSVPKPATAAPAILDELDVPTRSLGALVRGLTYDATHHGLNGTEARIATGEALTKRRRLEVTDTPVLAPPHKTSESHQTTTVKRQKAPKKKPQTITALATEAFRPARQPDIDLQTRPDVSAPHDRMKGGGQADLVQKPKKTRKPRAKKAADTTKGKVKIRRPARPRKKVKFDETDCIPKLFTPREARAQEQSQGFLFGTSSQLRAEESPTFIRQIQLALSESEVPSTSNNYASPLRKSCMKIPTAPHGTNLSIGQADRELWCTSARDNGGSLMNFDGNLPLAKTTAVKGVQSDVQLPSSPPVSEGAGDVSSLPSQTWGCDKSSPVEEQKDDCVPYNGPSIESAIPPVTTELEMTTPPASPLMDEDWKMLSSSPPPVTTYVNTVENSPQGRSNSPRGASIAPMVERVALAVLDSNAHLSCTSPQRHPAVSQHRSFTQSAVAAARKTAPAALKAKRRPGIADLDKNSTAPSPARRGRPPKLKSNVSDAAISRPKSGKTVTTITSSSQPITTRDWTNIDEISDSDAPCTPSPPRRRASSSPPSVRPLKLSTITSPSPKAKANAPSLPTSKLKATDEEWSLAMKSLFARINETVKSAPRSEDINAPSWHQKILLYDPIVLEDFTAWLNAQGLRVETRRLKPVAKATNGGRRKKDAAVLVLPDETEQYETCSEDLKPWMVQKWCEEKSVCCLWKEGLRGGVKGKY